MYFAFSNNCFYYKRHRLAVVHSRFLPSHHSFHELINEFIIFGATHSLVLESNVHWVT